MEKRSEKLIKNTAILGFGTLCTKGIMFFMSPLFTRWLSQSDYGTFDLILTYVSLFIPILTLDCGEAVFRFLLDKKDQKDEKNIVTNALVIDIIGFLFALIVIAVLAIVNEKIRSISLLFIGLLIVESVNFFLTMVIRGIKKLNIYAISNIIFVLAMVISVTLFVKVFNLKIEGILLGYIFGYIASTIFMVTKTQIYKYVSFQSIDTGMIKKMLKYSIPLIPNELSWWIVNVSDRTVVSAILGMSSNAILAVANKIPNLCQTIFNVFHLSWQESASETINDKDREIYYTNVFNNMIVILCSISVVVLSGNFLIFKILFTEEYFVAYYQVPILTVAIIVSMLAQFFGGIYVAQKESWKNGKTTVISAVCNIIIHFSLIKFIGLYAATISTLSSYLILLVLRYIDIRKILNIKINKKSLICLIILLYFVLAVYLNNIYLNYINILLATFIFFYINKENIKKILEKKLKRN